MPYNPSQSYPLNIHPSKMKTYIHKCLFMFTVALFIIAPNWKQPKYPSTGWLMGRISKDQISTLKPKAYHPNNRASYHCVLDLYIILNYYGTDYFIFMIKDRKYNGPWLSHISPFSNKFYERDFCLYTLSSQHLK